MRREPSGGRGLGGAEEQYALLMACVTDHAIFLMDTEGRVATWNAGAERIFGYPQEEVLGRPADFVFTPEDRERGVLAKEMRVAAAEGRAADDRWHVRKGCSRFWANGAMTALRGEGDVLRGFAKVCRDLTAQKQAEAERERLIRELQDALARVKTLSGLLPICAWCKKVRNDEGYWERLEAYFQGHFDLQFTHGMCPDCCEKALSEMPGGGPRPGLRPPHFGGRPGASRPSQDIMSPES